MMTARIFFIDIKEKHDAEFNKIVAVPFKPVRADKER